MKPAKFFLRALGGLRRLGVLLVAWLACLLAPAALAQDMPSLLDEVTTQIANGFNHTCALTSTGTVKCWGLSFYGQLGDGSTTDRLTPVDVSGLASGVAALAAGNYHTCALTIAGAVKCWGFNGDGQLGDGSTTTRLTPVDVSGLASGVTALAAGGYHTCALTNAGAVKCWGYNAYGQLGDGSATQRLTPMDVDGLASGVVALAAGVHHTCALTSAGAVKCWGYNAYGQLGDGSATDRLTPVDVSGLASGVAALAAGSRHTCALTIAGAVKCWGYNGAGQLGDGSTTDRLTPVDVSGLASGMATVAAGAHHTCALTSAGAVKCWGFNGYGQLGDGSATDRTTPVDVSGLASDGVALAAGIYHTCALTRAGAVKCWGWNVSGQLGDGSTTNRLTPVDVSGLASGVIALAATSLHTCALTSAGAVKCWGYNSTGQLGNGSTTTRLTPVDVSGLASGVVALAARGYHTCALTRAGTVKCWGDNGNGQLGDGSTTSRLIPVDVSGLASGGVALAAGEAHTCVLTSIGVVKCWGRNAEGQLGDGSTTQRLTPVDVSGLASGVVAIALGTYHTCALTSAGAVKCWGRNDGGQLGDGSTTDRLTPVDVSGLASGVVALAAGRYHTCALTSAGAVKCWGYNESGQLGDGSTTQRLTPVDVSGLASGVVTLAAGEAYTCALTGAGAVKCWGKNFDGQLGDGSTTNRLTPVDVSGLTSGGVAITAGGLHTCALTSAGAVKCWGRNGSGQLGLGDTSNRHVPATVRGGQSLAFLPGTPASPLHTALSGVDLELTASTSGGGSVPIVFDTWTSDTCTVSGTTLQITGAPGSLCGVRASRAGGPDGANGTTAPAPQQLRLLRIARNDTLSVSVTGQGSVDVSPDPAAGGIDACDEATSPCTVSYGEGDATDLTLVATPTTGWHVDAWSGDCTPATDLLTASLSLDADKTCAVGFAINQYTVTFVDWDGTTLATQTVNHGDDATAPADPTRIGYTFTGWDVDFSNVTAPLTVTAHYTLNQYTVTASVSGANGSIAPASQTVNHNDAATFTVTPNAGYHVVEPLGGDCPAGTLTGTSYVTGPIVANCEVIASFAQNAAEAIAVQGGNAQSVPVLAAFGDALAVRVADAADVPLEGVSVTFAAPAAGASAVLSSTTATTDASGIASITATANAIAGSYVVTAGVPGVATPASFALENTPFSTTLALTVSPPMLPPNGTATLTATVTGEGSLVPGGTVDFLVDGEVACAAVPVDANGIATCTAGPFGPGQHEVSASYSGDDAHAPAVSAAAVGLGVRAPVLVPVDHAWARFLLIVLLALLGQRAAVGMRK